MGGRVAGAGEVERQIMKTGLPAGNVILEVAVGQSQSRQQECTVGGMKEVMQPNPNIVLQL